MSKIKVPGFKSYEEEAEFWDSIDTTKILEEGEEVDLEYAPLPDDICVDCGNKMDVVEKDMDLLDGEITLHKVKKYYCKVCNRFFLSSAEAQRLSEILIKLCGVKEDTNYESEINFDEKGWFIRLPREIMQKLNLDRNYKAKIWTEGRRIVVTID